MRHSLKFNLPEVCDVRQLIGDLADHYSIKKERPISEPIAFYDTFDWLLFNKSLVLFESGNRFVLRNLYENTILHSAQITTPPVFIEEFPEGGLKEHLAPIVKIRALLKLVEVYSRKVPYRVLNQDEKIVARLVFEEIWKGREKHTPAISACVGVNPMKGYPRYSQELARHLEKAGCTVRENEDVYFDALRVVDKKPGDYSTKLDIQLAPDIPVDEATRIILRFLLDIIKINEAKIEEDLDTEFLHDFRVAIRRTRSALRQMKNVFPAEMTKGFRKDLAFVGKISNQLRDLDVYLLNEVTYKAMLPEVLRDDIAPLFDHLREKRSKAFHKVIRSLGTRKYKNILKGWDRFLHEAPKTEDTGSHAHLPVIEVARKRIYKKYRKIIEDGNAIIENTKDEMLHRLRIECKELRYLLEFFASLFPRDKINLLIEQLKRLQDNLGDFNDFCIQEEYLLNIAGELSATDEKAKKTLVAIGSLIGTLDRKKQTVKGKFAKTFEAFASPENKKAFRELFTAKKKGAGT